MTQEPSRLVLRDLERIAERRAEVEAVTPADDGEAEVRRLLLATLDEMEEELCARGRRAPELREGWQRLARFESFAGCNGRRR